MGKTTEEKFSIVRMANIECESHNAASNNSEETQTMIDLVGELYDHSGEESNYVLVGFYVPVISVAVVANICIIVVVFKNDYMRSSTNFFVVNLSVAHLLLTIVCMSMAIIIQAISIAGHFEEISCKLIFYFQGAAVAASMFTITMMSIDRYMAIKNPNTFRRSFHQRKMRTVILVIWLTSFGIFGLLLKAVKTYRFDEHKIGLRTPIGGGEYKFVGFKPPTIAIYFENFLSLGIDSSYFSVTCFLLVYAIPVSIVLVVYIMIGHTLYARRPPLDVDSVLGSARLEKCFRLLRERKRIAWVVLILAALFTVCWFPYNVLRLLLDFGYFARKSWVADTLSYFLFFGHMNSMLNPLVYCFMTRTFRHSISELLCQWRCGAAQRKPHRNRLAGGACTCSIRGARNRMGLSQITIYSAGKIHRSPSAQVEMARARSVTPSAACDSLKCQHSPDCRCRFSRTSPKLMAVLKESRGCSQNDLTILRNLGHNVGRKKSPNGKATLNEHPGEIRPTTRL